MLKPVRPVRSPVHRQALRAASRVPVLGGPIAVQVGQAAGVVVLFDPRDNAVSPEGSQAAGVRVVGRTDERKAIVVGILVAVDGLPVAIRVVFERVGDGNDATG